MEDSSCLFSLAMVLLMVGSVWFVTILPALGRRRQREEWRETQIQKLRRQLEERDKQIQELWRHIEERDEEIHKIAMGQVRAWLLRWSGHLAVATYRNEIEVEIKFIRPLVRYLGYREENIELRVPMDLQIGTQYIKGEADWVLWDKKTDPTNPSVVIEAKAPNQALDDKVQGQARSYAFVLNAPVYAITNGKRLRIFRRGIQSDACVIDCNVTTDLLEAWDAIEQAMGRGRVTE